MCSELMQLLPELPIPIIAQVEGLATAAGCQLVASCDLAVAGQSAQFMTPGVKIGLFCHTPGVALARTSMPSKQALNMLFTGDAMSADEALLYGLVTKVVSDKTVSEKTISLAEKIATASRATLGMGKIAFYKQSVQPCRKEAYEYASAQMVTNLADIEDATEGIGAFLEKRQPCWKHK